MKFNGKCKIRLLRDFPAINLRIELKILMIVIAVHILMQPVQNLNAITISVQLMYVAAAILAVNFLYTKKLKRSLQKMNMKRFLHLTYLSKHLGMESRKVIVDTERESNLLILLNISMIN